MTLGSDSIESQFNISRSNSNAQNIYVFESFQLDVDRLMLYKAGKEIEFAPKVVETLLALIEKRGAIVSGEEMFSRVWKNSFVDPSNLTQNIYLLRKALGSMANGAPFIETFRRRGYRFNGEVANLVAAESEKPSGHSLAVLPFKNESADLNAEYLSDGITESIINRLSQLDQLRVVARGTTFRYKGKNVVPSDIGRELGVNAILTGRVLQLGDSLIVRAELVETATGWQVWGKQFDSRDSNILGLQETIAKEISENLQLKLTGEDRKRLSKRFTDSTEAYHLYIKGRYYLHKRRAQSIQTAADFFQQAVGIDPEYALAWVGLADCYPLLSLYGEWKPADAYPHARSAVTRALEIDDRLSEAYNALGVVRLFYEWDWNGAEAAFRTAIELNPGRPDAHQRYGMLLTILERFDEAEFELRLAQELDPLSLITKTIGGYPFYYSRDYTRAARRFQEVLAMDSDYSMAHFRLGLTYAHQRKYDEAIAELRAAQTISNDRDSVAALGYVHGLAGNLDEAEAAVAAIAEREKTGFVSAYDRVLLNLGIGDREMALDRLEQAVEERSYWLIYLNVDPALDSLRDHPRFAAIARRVFPASV